MKHIYFLALSLLISLLTFGQEFEYRDRSNNYYWKNRPPFPGYWQQDIHYKIKAKLDEKRDAMDGAFELTYYNNSPDTLKFVFFHLYQNAFQPNSYTDDLHRNNDFPVKFGKNESAGLGTTVDDVRSDGAGAKYEIDNTIMKVWLSKPLAPGSSTVLSMNFSTYFDIGGSIRRRMKMFQAWQYKHYDGVHWYPRISVYDRKFGWDTDQHLTREFYGEFGTFEVELSFPNFYVMDATGLLQNKDEVLPKDLRDSLDISRFVNRPWDSPPRFNIPDNGTYKTWKFRAVNVHDFAWTADPTYRIGETEWNGIKLVALAQEGHCAGWKTASLYAARVIQVFSEDIGMYGYPKMIVADARDGMEYPMLTLNGGFDPDYRDLLTHEIGHNWFMGMVGTNETYRAFMDEGFTQFLTAHGYQKINGPYRIEFPAKSSYVRKHIKPDLVINSELYNAYLHDAVRGEEATLNTHSDQFNGALRHGGGYRQVYMKTGTMLYNLQYVLGEELFMGAMRYYFEKWKFAHPYPEDFRTAVTEYTKVDLNWFFDQWLETTKTIDYAVKGVKHFKDDQYVITFKRKGRMQMPVEFRVISKTDSAYDYYIPNTWFEKKTTATILPRWLGFDKVRKEYQATVTIPGGIKNVIIDTSRKMADVNMLNNSLKTPLEYTFDHRIYNVPDWTKYELAARPDLWYNGYDGIKTGVHVNGHYMRYHHIFDANLWLNTGIAQHDLSDEAEINRFDEINYRLNYKTATDKLIRGSNVYLTFKSLEGLQSYLTGFEFSDSKKKNIFNIDLKSMYRADSSDLQYLLNPEEWQPDRLNNSLTLSMTHPYTYKQGNGEIELGFRTNSLLSDYDFSSVSLSAVNKNKLGKFGFNSRFFAQYGTGSDVPFESMLFIAGANPEQLMENKFTRSRGIFPSDWAEYGATTNHFHYGGGLNLRGYAGYVAPELADNGDLLLLYKGLSGVAFNAELEFQNLFRNSLKFMRKSKAIDKMFRSIGSIFELQTYLFSDVGMINSNLPGEKLSLTDLRADAGVGAAFTIKRFPPLQMVKPLTIRFDMPFFLNRIPAVDQDYFQFRWVIGVNRAF